MLAFIIASAALGLGWTAFGARALALLALPFFMTLYYVTSTLIGDFGTWVPFAMFDETARGLYDFMLLTILLHFLAALAAVLLADRFPVNASATAGGRPLSLRSYRARLRAEPLLGHLFFAICLAPGVLVLIAVGADELWDRLRFVPDFANRPLMRFADVFFWIAAVICPFLAFRWQRFVVLLSVVTAFAALGSRAAPVMLIIFVAFNIMDRHRDSKVWKSIALAATASWLLALLLLARSMGSGGLAFLLQLAFSTPVGIYADFVVFGINYLTNFSVVINAHLYELGIHDLQSFWYAVSPFPSALSKADWYDAVNRFRANIPFPGFAFVLSHLGIVLYLCLVFLVTFAVRLALRMTGAQVTWFGTIAFYAWVFLPLLVSLQYNLRTSFRLWYVTLAFCVLAAGIASISSRAGRAEIEGRGRCEELR